MPLLSRHLGFSAVERHEEKLLWTTKVVLLQALTAAAMVVSMMHAIMVQALAFIVQLIEHANSLRFTVLGQRRNFDNVSDFIKFIVFYLKLFYILI
jgi:hypothetical protein